MSTLSALPSGSAASASEEVSAPPSSRDSDSSSHSSGVGEELFEDAPEDLPRYYLSDCLHEHPALTANLLNFLAPADMCELRLANRFFMVTVRKYLEEILLDASFLRDTCLYDFKFWERSMAFFTKQIVSLKPKNRLRFGPVVACLKKNKKQGFPVATYQMSSWLTVSLDDLPPGAIQMCHNTSPARHTCSLARRLTDIPMQCFSDEVSLSTFLSEYLERIASVTDDQLLWASHLPLRKLPHTRPPSPAFMTLLFETFLLAIQRILRDRAGVLVIRKVELLANCSVSVYHRVWLQLSLHWGWESGCVGVRRRRALKEEKAKAAAEAEKAAKRKKWGPGTSKRVTGGASGTSVKKAPATPPPPSSLIPPGRHSTLFFTLADHFQWDA